MIDIIQTSKISLDSKTIESSSFYSKGQDYYYIGNEKGISLEETADLLCGEKAIFLYKKEDEIFIVFTHLLKDTITLPFGGNDDQKFLSILSFVLLQTKVKTLYALNVDSNMLDNLAIPVSFFTPEQFIKAAKRLRPLHTTQTQFTKALVIVLICVGLIVAQSFAFDFLKENSRIEYNNEKQKIQANVLQTAKEYKKYENMISELPTSIASSYKDIVDELSGVQK